MRHWKSALLSLAGVVVLGSAMAQTQQSSANASKPAAKGDTNPVHSITLPDYAPEVPQGPNVDTFTNNCLLCHSARYVLTQPRFSESVWTSEVKKMVGVYGASISDADQTKIIEYLTAVHGVTAPASPANSQK